MPTKRGGYIVEIQQNIPSILAFMDAYGIQHMKTAIEMLVLEGLKSHDFHKGPMMGKRSCSSSEAPTRTSEETKAESTKHAADPPVSHTSDPTPPLETEETEEGEEVEKSETRRASFFGEIIDAIESQ